MILVGDVVVVENANAGDTANHKRPARTMIGKDIIMLILL
jgi:hypothetical protein